jgi:hypothetical protein
MLSNGASSTTDLLTLVLSLLDSLTGALCLGEDTQAYKTVLGLELHHSLLVVVDKAESGGLSSSELGAESEGDDKLGVSLVHTSDNSLELGLSYVSTSRVDDVYDHLQERNISKGKKVRLCEIPRSEAILSNGDTLEDRVVQKS